MLTQNTGFGANLAKIVSVVLDYSLWRRRPLFIMYDFSMLFKTNTNGGLDKCSIVTIYSTDYSSERVKIRMSLELGHTWSKNNLFCSGDPQKLIFSLKIKI